MNIKNHIGDYEAFFSDLVHRMTACGIDVLGYPMSHLLYRVVTMPEYEALRDNLIPFCETFAETKFNGRAVSVLNLREPLQLEGGFEVASIELPAPRPVHIPMMTQNAMF